MAKIWLALLLVATLGSVGAVTDPIEVEDVKALWDAFTADTTNTANIDNCKQQQHCLSEFEAVGQAATGTDLTTLCEKISAFSVCAQGSCKPSLETTKLEETEDLCKIAKLEKVLADIKLICTACDTKAGDVEDASGLDGKCQASKTYLTCLTDGTCQTAVPAADDLEALKTPCKATTGTETTTETAATTVDPFDVVRSMWATFKNDQNIATNCVDTTCPSTAVEDALTKDLDTFCKAIGMYSVCAKANCTSTLTDTLLDQMNDQCKTASTLGGDDDDGCSILQVSTLALMLSLLLSII